MLDAIQYDEYLVYMFTQGWIDSTGRPVGSINKDESLLNCDGYDYQIIGSDLGYSRRIDFPIISFCDYPLKSGTLQNTIILMREGLC